MKKKLFVNIVELSSATGVSEWYFRTHVEDIPHIKSGKKYLFNIEQVEEYLLNKAKGGEQ